MSKRLVLASTSRYRRELLQRLAVPFECLPPGTDETLVPDESPADRALRLARAKAEAVAAREPGCVVIGSDQVASVAVDQRLVLLEKPGTPERWAAQLALLPGRSVHFHTAVVVLDQGVVRSHVDVTRVDFRRFDAAEAARYRALEPAMDCAGGFKAEGAGVALMSRMVSEDPTAIVGLPLIWLAGALRETGFAIP